MARRDEARAFLASLPDRVQMAPAVNLEKALVARDGGDEAAARGFLAEAGRLLRTPALERALGAPMPAWPPNLRSFLTDVPDARAVR